MRVDTINNFNSQLSSKLHIPLCLLKHWVDEQCLFGGRVHQQVRVGAAFLVEELAD